jgi:hypothetical protein
MKILFKGLLIKRWVLQLFNRKELKDHPCNLILMSKAQKPSSDYSQLELLVVLFFIFLWWHGAFQQPLTAEEINTYAKAS